jgi:hypothetical protein
MLRPCANIVNSSTQLLRGFSGEKSPVARGNSPAGERDNREGTSRQVDAEDECRIPSSPGENGGETASDSYAEGLRLGPPRPSLGDCRAPAEICEITTLRRHQSDFRDGAGWENQLFP